MKLATWNINSLRVRLEHVLRWLERAQPDVLALQETKIKDDDFPVDAFEPLGYFAVSNGQPGYNGVAVVAKQPPALVSTEIDGFVDTQRRLLGVTFGPLRVLNLYVPNGQNLLSEKYEYKLAWLDALREHLASELARHPYLAVVGDFNIAPDDRDVHNPLAWQGKVLCSPRERAALAALEQVGLGDVFRLFEQPEKSFSWWDYRAGAFRRNQGLRIDLILASKQLGKACTACRIDPEPRGWERPSDHAPVLAEFRLT